MKHPIIIAMLLAGGLGLGLSGCGEERESPPPKAQPSAPPPPASQPSTPPPSAGNGGTATAPMPAPAPGADMKKDEPKTDEMKK